MALIPARNPGSVKPSSHPRVRDQSGIALFMVMAAMGILSILVTDFTYISRINQQVAYDGLDQVRAHYLAKSGFKLSLLRLKAYQHVKQMISQATGGSGGSAPGIPKSILEKIWSFPFIYPLPTSIPGLSMGDKDAITKFQKESGLTGNFTAQIDSESSRYNMNMILAQFVPSTTTTTSTTAPGGTVSPAPSPSPQAQFDPQAARQSLYDYLAEIFNNKVQSDEDFSDLYKGFQLQELVDGIVAWADRTVDPRTVSVRDLPVPLKRAPFYTLSELHMVPLMDDTLYALFSPALTVSTTPGINVNTMNEHTLRALVPGITDEEVKKFYEFRDNQDEDNLFKADSDFFSYLQNNVALFRNDATEIKNYQTKLAARNVRIVVEETEFKITVQAKVGGTTRLLEAWVTLLPPKSAKATPPGSPPPPPVPAANPADPNAPPPRPDSGLKVTFMRIL